MTYGIIVLIGLTVTASAIYLAFILGYNKGHEDGFHAQ